VLGAAGPPRMERTTERDLVRRCGGQIEALPIATAELREKAQEVVDPDFARIGNRKPDRKSKPKSLRAPGVIRAEGSGTSRGKEAIHRPSTRRASADHRLCGEVLQSE
jgi:hypothetical protein